jgi:myo-inositol-1(or 4)-monophosphatase
MGMASDPELTGGGISPADLLGVAVEAATAAGRHALEHEHRRQEVASRFAHDVKLLLDFECQRVAEEVVRRTYPRHSILGEEGTQAGETGQPEWVIDPIDGTVNFTHGIRYWCTSVAVRAEGRIVAGAVYAPALGELYTAAAGAPALLNGQPIRVSPTEDPAHAIVFTGMAKNLACGEPSLELIRRLSAHVQKIRIMGAAALDICHVARGAADAFMEAGINIWDVAAGSLVVERAGGCFEALRALAPNRMQYLCTNGRLHPELRRRVLEVLDG